LRIWCKKWRAEVKDFFPAHLASSLCRTEVSIVGIRSGEPTHDDYCTTAKMEKMESK
jgi:hypothetical protein